MNPLAYPRFPRSSSYDADWIFENQMGPNVLWLTEWLTEALPLHRGERLLDMGCGKALSSIYLAREHEVIVFANDLWIPATENWARVVRAGLQDRVFPIHAEAHALPYAEGFFDAAVSMDSYQYYGTDDLYLGVFHKLVRPGGRVGIVVPALVKDFEGGVPEHLTRRQASGGVFWAWDCVCFHTRDWWATHLGNHPSVRLDDCVAMPDGCDLWLRWEKALHVWPGEKMFPSDVETLGADAGRYLTFVRAVMTRTA